MNELEKTRINRLLLKSIENITLSVRQLQQLGKDPNKLSKDSRKTLSAYRDMSKLLFAAINRVEAVRNDIKSFPITSQTQEFKLSEYMKGERDDIDRFLD